LEGGGGHFWVFWGGVHIQWSVRSGNLHAVYTKCARSAGSPPSNMKQQNGRPCTFKTQQEPARSGLILPRETSNAHLKLLICHDMKVYVPFLGDGHKQTTITKLSLWQGTGPRCMLDPKWPGLSGHGTKTRTKLGQKSRIPFVFQLGSGLKKIGSEQAKNISELQISGVTHSHIRAHARMYA